MSGSPNLAPPGSSTYSSGILHVGDGTWDYSTDTFLLPNIQGLNFDTMRYNGMGNRFRALNEYHTLITAHGVIAAITFLGVVPAAILIASFYHANGRLALRIHISLQILTVLLATVILVLGYFAVGPERSLTNPHHGIGVAIYVLIIIQAIGGWVIHKIEKGKMRYHIPIKLMLHQWVGRAIALLALAQIPIGLTLYGSPLALFVLYAISMFGLLVLYFVLSYQSKKRAAAGYDERGSYVTGTQTEVTDAGGESHHRGRWAALTGALVGGAGLAALRKRRSERRVDQSSSVPGSRADSASYVTEKYDGNQGYKESPWRDRLLGATVGAGAFSGLKSLMNRGGDREAESEISGAYRPPLAGPLGGSVTQSTVHVNAMEEGIPAADMNQHRLGPGERGIIQQEGGFRSEMNSRPSRDSLGTYSTERSRSYERGGPFAGLIAFSGLGRFFQKRRERKEKDRIDAERQREYENERIFGTHGDQQTHESNGAQRREGVRFDTATNGLISGGHFGDGPPIPPIPVTNFPSSSTYGYGSAGQRQQPPPPPPPQSAQIPPPPTGPPRANLFATRGQNTSGQISPGLFAMDGRQRDTQLSNTMRDMVNDQPQTADPNRNEAGPGRAIQEPPAVASPRNIRAASRDSENHGESPPVSVKVNMHNDGRRVTVRRLNQDEAAVERDGLRRGNGRERQRGEGSYGMTSNDNTSARDQYSPRSRRQPPSGQVDPSQQASELNLPSPQGVPYAGSPSATGGFGNSPGAGTAEGYDTGTDSYDTNRRRRRAERARAEQARQEARGAGGMGGRVEFT